MKKFLEQILVDPVSGKILAYDETQNLLHTDDYDNIYELVGEVPVILPKEVSIVASPFHQTLKTNFNYSAHYKKDAETHNYFKNEENAATKNEIRRLHEAIIHSVPPNAHLILDAGCGNAWLANCFLKKNRQVISMDISTVNPARAIRENPHSNHAALVADIFHLPIESNSIDCIVAAEVMEHVYDPSLFIDRLIEKLKPGGKLIITTPFNERIEYYLCIHCNLPTPKNAHLHSFNKKNIKEIISNKNVSWHSTSFANKYLIKSRINLILGILPFTAWRLFDLLTNALLTAPTRFLIEIYKI
jgi:2-polyprenyl-3-methyl-5-hydroxy-6-metoxy-1,4-benzoquinol methylase/uncharacterized protein YbaR (Trm112 family)